MSAYEKLAGLIVERGAVPIVGRREAAAPELGGLGDRLAELREQCARLVEGNVYKQRYRQWPTIGPGNRVAEDDVTYYCDRLAAEIRKIDLCDLRTAAPALPVDAGGGQVQAVCDPSGRGWRVEGPGWQMQPVGLVSAGQAEVTCKTAASAFAAAPQPPGVSLAPDALVELEATLDGLSRNSFSEVAGKAYGHARQLVLAIAQAEIGKAGASEAGPINDVFNAKCKLIQTFYVALDARVRSDEQRKEKAEQLFLNTVNEVLAWASKPAPTPEPSRQGVEAMRDVAAERERQRTVEGWTPEHDDTHNQGEMALAAAHYAIVSVAQALPAPSPEHPSQKFWLHQHADAVWPWDIVWRKPKDRRRNLVRAGALIVAEIERLDRAALAQHQGGGQTSGSA